MLYGIFKLYLIKESSMSKQSDKLVPIKNDGFFDGMAGSIRLIWRLIRDRRVNPLLKLLPVGSMIYLIAPDFLPLNPIDDVLIIWLGSYLFIELCPPEIVQEHQRLMNSVIDAEWHEIDEDK
jgi:hypothetical protein